MKSHPRIRKTIKWGGAAVTVLLVVVWVGSGWCGMYWDTGGPADWGITGGVLWVDYAEGIRHLTPPQTYWGTQRFVLDFGADGYRHAQGWRLDAPLWWPVIVVLAGTAMAWRLDTLARRRDRLNLCPQCSYDRAGLGAGVRCPECGAAGMSVTVPSGANEPRTE